MANNSDLLQAQEVDTRSAWERRTSGIQGHWAQESEDELAEARRWNIEAQAKLDADKRAEAEKDAAAHDATLTKAALANGGFTPAKRKRGKP